MDRHGDAAPEWNDRERGLRLSDVLPAGMLAIFGLAGLIAASLAMGDTDQFVVIAAPWTSRAEMTQLVWQSDGGIAGYGAIPGLVVAMSDAPDFKQRLHAQGAWFAFPSPRFLGCSGYSKDDKR